jgi:large subunit ribosomal protein L1
MKKSKRMLAELAKIDKSKVYTVDEAVELVKQTSKAGFDASIEVHIKLGIDPKKSEQQIRTTVALPHGTGKTKKVAAFVGPNHESDAKTAGADFIYGEDEIANLKNTGKIEFDIAVSTPEMMPKLASVAKILGPRGLMPNPKTDTVGTDVKKMISELKKGKAAFKNDDTGNVHISIGKSSFSADQIKENFYSFIDALRKIKPNTAKGTYLKAVYLTSTMGPSIKVNIE